MIQTLLVDDEPMTRSGLRRFIDWGNIGIEIAGEAEDGIEAYEKFVQLRPELVLCDVRMPRMDGIEFARRVRQIDPDCKLIFLSGYNDLDYLKSAIKLQAVDYMLKPIQMGELTRLLEETAETIRTARIKRSELSAMREQFHRSRPELQKRLLKTLLRLSPDYEQEMETLEEDIARLSPMFPAQGFYQCVVFEFQNEGARQCWEELAEAEANSAGLPVLTAVLNGKGVAAVALSSPRGDDKAALWLNQLLRRRDREEKGIVAGTGEVCHHINGCRASYDQALKALSHRFYRGWHTAIRSGSLPAESVLPSLFDKQAYLKFEEQLRGKQLRAAGDTLDQVLNELLLYPQNDIGAVRKKLFRWYVAMTRIYSETMWEFENDQLWASLFVTGELYTIRKFMLERLVTIQEALEKSDSSDKAVIRDILRFIQENYRKEISINAIAEHVHLAPTYMCILFKKEKGVSINDYITQSRIEEAKELLRDRKLKLYEVSARVGYQDANYFSKVFRKLTGMIPSQYRDTLQDER